MIKILILTLFISLLNAANPTIYSALGDIIYNNVEKIKQLQTMEEYTLYRKEIKSYVQDVQNAKKLAFAIESGKEVGKEKEYLSALRALSKQNDYFLRSVELNYKKSLDEKNTKLFSRLINSGLIETQKRKDEIMDFYFKHHDDINTSGVIESFLEEDEKLKKQRDEHLANYKTKKMKEEERIKRVRARDIEAQKKLEQILEAEVKRKKQEIRENQKSELIR